MDLDQLVHLPPYSLDAETKERELVAQLRALQAHHESHCEGYARIVRAMKAGASEAQRIEDFPFLPVRIFKEHDLRSVSQDEVVKTLTSSGTTGAVSRIHLDAETASLQGVALATIMREVLGPTRVPMLIVDSRATVRDRTSFSARGAGILGMMSFGRHHTFALDDGGLIDLDAVSGFLERFSGQPFLVFGFTFMVWQHLYQPLAERAWTLEGATVIHSGGWKRLEELAVSNQEFRQRLVGELRATDVRNFYGMVEQTGSVFVEGRDGFLRCPNFADVVIRDPRTWAVLPDGQPGLIEVVSALPRSYPGHCLLTEDLGVGHGTAPSPEGWQGRAFSVQGRLPRAELRGCSDVYAMADA